jgi:hypothetical protein
MTKSDTIFDFETDFAGSLYCIPMCVRLKLDICGIKLSLKQWNRIPEAERRKLIEEPCDLRAHIDAYRAVLIQLIENWTSSAPEEVEMDPAPPWADASCAPARLVAYSAAQGVPPPSQAQWGSLSPLQRFALFKLTRPGHSNDNFIPAMREFGMLKRQDP